MLPTVIVDFLAALGFIYMFVILYGILFNDQKRTTDYVQRSKIDHRCKVYLQTIKGNIKTSVYALFISLVCSFLTFIILKLSKPYTQMSNNIIYLTTLLTIIVTFGTSNKFIDCLITRNLCPGDCGVFDSSI